MQSAQTQLRASKLSTGVELRTHTFHQSLKLFGSALTLQVRMVAEPLKASFRVDVHARSVHAYHSIPLMMHTVLYVIVCIVCDIGARSAGCD